MLCLTSPTLWRALCRLGTGCRSSGNIWEDRDDQRGTARKFKSRALSLERCAVLYNFSPRALYRLICTLGQQSVVTMLTRCGLLLPVYFPADEKHSKCLTDKMYLPTTVSGRVIWHLGYTT